MTAGVWADLHEDAVRRLDAWQAPDAIQQRLREDFLAHLLAHPLAVAKTGPPAHLTASVVVLDDELTSVLLTHHRRARAWFQLGGHLERADRTLHASATREATEESGIRGLSVLPVIAQLDRHVLHGDFGSCREHLDVRFVAVVPRSERHEVSAESLDVRWWRCDSLPEQTRDELLPLVAAGRRVAERLTRR